MNDKIHKFQYEFWVIKYVKRFTTFFSTCWLSSHYFSYGIRLKHVKFLILKFKACEYFLNALLSPHHGTS